jgi:hypothetical protein
MSNQAPDGWLLPGMQLRWAGIFLTCLLGAACGMNLRSAPPHQAQTLDGHWQLQSPQREVLANQLRAVLQQAQATQQLRERRRRAVRGDDDLSGMVAAYPDSDAPADTTGVPQSERRPGWIARTA